MKKNEKFDVTVPFPAWDGIFQVNYICGELRRNEMLKGVPDLRTPRRITMKPAPVTDGFDDCKVVEYWFTGGCFANAALGGRDDDHYGTSWRIVSLRLRWRDTGLGLRMDDEKIIDVQLKAEQLQAIRLTSQLRRGLSYYEGRSNYGQAQEQLAEAIAASDAVIAELAAPIRAAYERQRIWVATLEAQREGREFSWLPGNEPTLPPSPPAPEWKKEEVL